MKPLHNLSGGVLAAIKVASVAFAAAVVPPPPATTTLDVIRAKAESGNIAAQVTIGGMYEKGNGVPKDFAEAAKWFRKAADQGSADAQVQLGEMYALGVGVPKDVAEAMKWYRKAADQGNANATALVAQATTLYRKAADQGDANAQALLVILTQPKAVAVPPAGSAPSLAPSPLVGTAKQAAASNPQTDLKTTIQDIARLTKSGDLALLAKTYMPPDQYAQSSAQYASTPNFAEMAKNPQIQPILPQLQQASEAQGKAFEALKDQTPTYNTAGDEATYMMSPPPGEGDGTPQPITLVKIGGLWYLKTWHPPAKR